MLQKTTSFIVINVCIITDRELRISFPAFHYS